MALPRNFMRLSDTELSELLSALESDRCERKESFNGDTPEKVRQAVCAFANNLPGHSHPGVIFIGVRDDGQVINFPITDELLLSLAAIRSDGNIQPLPTLTVEKRQLLGADIAVVTVWSADAPPVRYKGRTYIRTGPRCDIASAQDERILNERRRYHNLPFDLQPIAFATLADLSQSTFESEYLPGSFSRDVLEANHRSYEERLVSCRMVDGLSHPCPTVLGGLVIAHRPRDLLPGAFIQFLRLDGTELGAPIVDEAAIDGRLSEVLNQVDAKIKAHIATRIDIHSQATETRHPDYPLAALQQLIRNAVMHRTYENTHAPIRVTWFRDRVEIMNPGGPYGIVTRQNFGDSGLTDYRNPHLAEAMKTLGFVQRFGVGIASARKWLSDNGNPPPTFDVQDTHVLVTIRSIP
jgi:ATP-dependent DNA helicase RecG